MLLTERQLRKKIRSLLLSEIYSKSELAEAENALQSAATKLQKVYKRYKKYVNLLKKVEILSDSNDPRWLEEWQKYEKYMEPVWKIKEDLMAEPAQYRKEWASLVKQGKDQEAIKVIQRMNSKEGPFGDRLTTLMKDAEQRLLDYVEQQAENNGIFPNDSVHTVIKMLKSDLDVARSEMKTKNLILKSMQAIQSGNSLGKDKATVQSFQDSTKAINSAEKSTEEFGEALDEGIFRSLSAL